MAYALLSVFDKTGLNEFALGLHEFGFKLMASGSTAAYLRERGHLVTEVADYTGSKEMLKGRIKTLHPAIHAGILAQSNPEDTHEMAAMNWEYIDLVAVNLYPFERTISKPNVELIDAIEHIDIGGVALLRAAAKNFERVFVLSDFLEYDELIYHLRNNSADLALRKNLAARAFQRTSAYDQAIMRFLTPTAPTSMVLYPVKNLRYGENPHQSATLFSETPEAEILGGTLLQGKELSYNNILDLDSALRSVQSFEKATVSIVKHNSPCGLASANNLSDAFKAALACDPISAFGSVIACNRAIDEEFVLALDNLFIECLTAPHFSNAALKLLALRKNCRLLQISSTQKEPFEWRSISNGFLRQQRDYGGPSKSSWQLMTKRKASAELLESLSFAWNVVAHVKSN